MNEARARIFNMILPLSPYLKTAFASLSALFLFSFVGHAAPQTGVLITPVTRNDAPSKTTLTLAANGKALWPIVISAKASDATKAVASELAGYLKRISGASFEVVTGDGKSGIILGTIQDFPTPALDKALEIVHSFDGKEAYAIRTREQEAAFARRDGFGRFARRVSLSRRVGLPLVFSNRGMAGYPANRPFEIWPRHYRPARVFDSQHLVGLGVFLRQRPSQKHAGKAAQRAIGL
jgi:hypothetical protein